MKKNHHQVKVLFITLFSFFFTASKSQSPDWAWAKSTRGNYDDISECIAADNQGNVYAVGSFNTAHFYFGIWPLNNSDATQNTTDLFIVKYDAAGNVIWAKSAGGEYDDAGLGVAVDSSGNVLMSGSFSCAQITFGSFTLVNHYTGHPDIFLVKYDPNGNVIWANSYGGLLDDYSTAVTTGINNEIFLAGNFGSDTVYFENTAFLNGNPGSYTNVFLAAIDSSGNIIWAKGSYGDNADKLTGVATDKYGNAYITGSFISRAITFDTATLYNTDTVSIPFTSDIFVAKYNTNGDISWCLRADGSSAEAGNCIVASENGIYVGGIFAGASLNLGGIIITKTDSNMADIFLARYDSSGNVVWAKAFHGDYPDDCRRLAIDRNENLFLTGSFRSPTIEFGSTVLINNYPGPQDVFIAAFNQSGTPLWAKSFGGSNPDFGNGIAVTASDALYVSGSFESNHIVIGNTTLINAGNSYHEFFLAKLDNVTGTADVPARNEITVFPNPVAPCGIIYVSNASAILEIEIYTITGENVYETTENRSSIVVPNFQQGIYLLHIRTKHDNVFTKFSVIKN